MSLNAFTLGKNSQLVVIAPTGQRVDLSIVTGFDVQQQTHKIRVRPLNGPTQAADLPDGWEFTLHLDRGTSGADDLFSQIEQGYWAGGNIGTGQVFQYVTETDGSTSTYQFDGVAMSLNNAGSYKQDAAVPQTIQGFASTRKRL